MDNIIYNSLSQYYNALSKLGYYKYKDVYRLLVLCFLRDFVLQDYRGIISKEDYHIIDRALNCLFGSSCLIPYSDYLKMGKLHIGEITELAYRIQEIEDANVLKSFAADGSSDSDIIILTTDDENQP